jgi:predicted phage tail protein
MIRGAGGGSGKSGGTAHVATEALDSLRSRAFAQVIDLICEGEVEGLVNGLQSIYLDKTPLQNADGTFNFTGITMQMLPGTQSQGYLPGFSDTEHETAVGVSILAATPVVRTITNTTVDAVRVRISTAQLTYQNPSTGDLGGNSVSYAVDIQSQGAGFVQMLTDTMSGKSTSKYERTYVVVLPKAGAPWDVRVRRLTPDSTASNSQNAITFESYTEIQNVKLRYPNSALVGLRLDSTQFSNIPVRAYDLKMLRIKVPSNYNASTRSYSGVWNGQFQIAWTDNPAWVFYDLVTNSRYGLGNFVPEASVDKWALYQIAQYCDQLVDDGFGGTEPRFTCNLYLQSRADAYKVLSDLVSVFRGMIYWASGSISLSQDSPQDAFMLFTPANVVDGLFTYSGASAKTRHTVALVTWNNPNDFYSQAVEYVEDSEMVALNGVIEVEVTATGCTSRGQAHRLGKWILLTERYQSETLAFSTGHDGALLRPGQVIKVADPVRAGTRRGGRLLTGSTRNILLLDQTVDAAAGGLTMSVVMPDGTVQTSTVATIMGQQVGLNTPLAADPLPGTIWIATNTAVAPQQFRVLSVGESKPGQYDVSCLAHNPSKFDAVDFGTVLTAPNVSALTLTPAAPTNLQITETLYAVGSDIRVKVTCSWRQVDGATGYLVSYVRDSQNAVSLGTVGENDVEVLNAEPGVYTFTVAAVNSVGVRGPASTVTQEVKGRGAPPANVTGFSLIPMAGSAYLSWNQATDLDVLIGGSVRIRHSPDVVTPVWKNAVDILPALDGTATRATVPLLSGTYLAKFVDSSDTGSLQEATIVTTVPAPLALNIVQSFTENPTFGGTYTSTQYDSNYSGVVIAAGGFVDDIVSVDDLKTWDYGTGVASYGEYLFKNAVDLGGVYTSTIRAVLQVAAVDVADTIDQRLQSVDDWLDLDGNFIDDVNAEVQLRTTEGNPSDPAAVWTQWKRFFVGDYKARAMQFKLVLTSQNLDHNVAVTGVGIAIDMPDRTINVSAVVSGAAAYQVTFAEPFNQPPYVGITASAMQPGDTFQVSNKTNSGFTVTFTNSAGTAISRTFDYFARGFGRQVG